MLKTSVKELLITNYCKKKVLHCLKLMSLWIFNAESQCKYTKFGKLPLKVVFGCRRDCRSNVILDDVI